MIKYNHDLVGNGLGNFHVDFSVDGAAIEMYGVECLFLGKQTYIHVLESTDTYVNSMNSELIRCRGIPTACITYKASRDKVSVLDICKTMYKGDLSNSM